MDELLQKFCKKITKEYDDALLSLLNECGVTKNEIKERCELKRNDGVDIIYIDGIPRIKIEETLEYRNNYFVCTKRLSLVEVK